MLPSHSTFLFFIVAAGSVWATRTCSVLDYGGVPDGKTDIAPAIAYAFGSCVRHNVTSNPADTVLYVPKGKYALWSHVRFDETDNFTIEIDGEIHLAFDPSLCGPMITFTACNNGVWRGNGAIYGHGDLWRPHGNLKKYPNRPRLVSFRHCNNFDISGVTLYNSPMFHIEMLGDNNVVHDMKIVADHIGTTDGFDVSGNNNYVHDVSVENGDECVTVKSPTDGFVAENIQCLHSAGCNIGSFGEGEGSTASVQNVYYRNVTQQYGPGGILLKSYPVTTGVVRNITYEDFTFTEVQIPIEITNSWCPHMKHCPPGTGNLTWDNITFKRIRGTGDKSRRPTIAIECLSRHECTGINFEDVKITKPGGRTGRMDISNACGGGIRGLPACK